MLAPAIDSQLYILELNRKAVIASAAQQSHHNEPFRGDCFAALAMTGGF
jgi:hypothetical protein